MSLCIWMVSKFTNEVPRASAYQAHFSRFPFCSAKGTHKAELSFRFLALAHTKLHLGKCAINQMSFVAGILHLLLISLALEYTILNVMS